jgi:hypothetical protein
LPLPHGRKPAADISPDGVPYGWSNGEFFQSSDCSATANVSWNGAQELLPPTLVRRPGAWAVRAGTTRVRMVRSYRPFDDVGPSPVCQVFQTSTYTSAFDYYTLEDVKVIPPLSVR